MVQGEGDSLTGLVEDMERALAVDDRRHCACEYYGKYGDDECDGCPAYDNDDPCTESVIADAARRLHALMPHDKDGVEIKPGDTVRVVGSAVTVKDIKVSGIRAVPFGDEVGSCGYVDTPVAHPQAWSVVQPDSWERLQEDAAKRVCEYAGAQRSVADDARYSCIGCPYDEPGPHTDAGCNERMRLDLVRRARALAGTGGGE